MEATTENSVSVSYRYMREGEWKAGDVIVLERMQNDSKYLQHKIANKIAEELKELGKSVRRDGKAVSGTATLYDESTRVDIFVSGLFDPFSLEVYDAGDPITLAVDQ